VFIFFHFLQINRSRRCAASRLKTGSCEDDGPSQVSIALLRASVIVCHGRDAAPPGSDLWGNAAISFRRA
jgi:hypothetical protein